MKSSFPFLFPLLRTPRRWLLGLAGSLLASSLPAAAQLQYLPVYDGTLRDAWIASVWERSPATPIVIDPAASAPGQDGTAIEVRFSPPGIYGGFGLADREPGWVQHFLYFNEVRTLEFDLYFDADSTGEDAITFVLEDAGLADNPPLGNLVPGWSVTSSEQRRGVWHHVAIDLAGLHPVLPRFHHFLFFNDGDGSGNPHFRLANIRLGWEPDVTPPVVQLTSVVPSYAYDALTVDFTTDEPATFRIEYGVADYDHAVDGNPDDWATSHRATLAGLAPGQTVQYRILASDHRIGGGAPNVRTLAGSFSMPPEPTTPPEIPEYQVTAVTGNRADLHWTTSRPCHAVLTYRKSGGADFRRELNTYLDSADFTLDLLEPNTAYTATLTVTDAFDLHATRTIGFTTGTAATPTVVIAVHPDQARPISPWIYGVNFVEEMPAPSRNLTFSRLGGNRWTAYNWESNDSNAGNDWGPYSNDRWLYDLLQFYHNDVVPISPLGGDLPGEAVRSRVAAHRQAGLASLITVPMLGYVAADHDGNVDILDPTHLSTRFRSAPYRKTAPFTETPDVTDGVAYMDEFVWALGRKFPTDIYSDPVTPTFISLDNEPEIWFSTHHEILPLPMPMAEYIQRTLDLASAIKDVAPSALIFGPASYGFNGLVNWQNEPGFDDPDYWAVDRYLDAVRTASNQAGRRLVDVYDFHWYSEIDVSRGQQGPALSTEQIQAIVQSPRGLWDPTFNEPSWVGRYLNQPVRILDRIQSRIDARMPGMNMAITEYNFWGVAHIAGGIAQADALGIFGQRGLFAANFWPQATSYPYAMAAFRMYRDFDGNRGAFGDIALPTVSGDTSKVAAYASRDSAHAGRYVIVALNRSGQSQEVAFQGLDAGGLARVYRLDDKVAAPVFVGEVPVQLATWVVTLPAYTVSTIEITPGPDNAAPTAASDSILRPSDSPVIKVPLNQLLANDTDPEHDALSILGVGQAQPSGAQVRIAGPFVLFTMPSGSSGHGSFEYTLSDGPGRHQVTGQVAVLEVAPPTPSTRPNAVAIQRSGESADITFLGVPGKRYRVQYASEAGPFAVWNDFQPAALHVTPDSGQFHHVDAEATGPARFYRAIPVP